MTGVRCVFAVGDDAGKKGDEGRVAGPVMVLELLPKTGVTMGRAEAAGIKVEGVEEVLEPEGADVVELLAGANVADAYGTGGSGVGTSVGVATGDAFGDDGGDAFGDDAGVAFGAVFGAGGADAGGDDAGGAVAGGAEDDDDIDEAIKP